MAEIEIFSDFVQRSPDWYRVRMCIPTCSQLVNVLRTTGQGPGGASKTRLIYKFKLAGEILTKKPMEDYCGPAMERGREQEEEAGDLYAVFKSYRPQKVAFIRNGRFGCSPDLLVTDPVDGEGLTELKSAAAHIQLQRLMNKVLPPEHEPQCMGALAVSQRRWIDFVSYCPDLPLFIKRVYRDERRIAEIKLAVDRFNFELDELVDEIRRMAA